jgi:hypothetical protein
METMRKVLFALGLTVGLVVPATAGAEVVPSFTFQITNPTSSGGYTVIFESRLSETTGALPPPLTASSIRLPAGAKLNREVLKRRYLCSYTKIQQALTTRGYAGAKKACKHAQVGFGNADADLRLVPGAPPIVPGTFDMFLGKGSGKNAVAALIILARSDQSSPIVQNAAPIIKDFKQVFPPLNFINDPSADGRFGYRLILPTGPLGGININIPIVRVKATTKGLTVTKKKTSCTKRKRGKCVKKKVTKKKIFWFNRPPCPASGELHFRSEYTFEGIGDLAAEDKVPCPQFPG